VVAVEQNLFSGFPPKLVSERTDELAGARGLRIERIVSTGHASPPGFWYDQPWAEWVVVLSGSAVLWLEGESQLRELKAGDYLLLAPHQRHRVGWTDPHVPTVWLAVHYGPDLDHAAVQLSVQR
jgi:cupin 2 domain-containing protein